MRHRLQLLCHRRNRLFLLQHLVLQIQSIVHDLVQIHRRAWGKTLVWQTNPILAFIQIQPLDLIGLQILPKTVLSVDAGGNEMHKRLANRSMTYGLEPSLLPQLHKINIVHRAKSKLVHYTSNIHFRPIRMNAGNINAGKVGNLHGLRRNRNELRHLSLVKYAISFWSINISIFSRVHLNG